MGNVVSHAQKQRPRSVAPNAQDEQWYDGKEMEFNNECVYVHKKTHTTKWDFKGEWLSISSKAPLKIEWDGPQKRLLLLRNLFGIAVRVVEATKPIYKTAKRIHFTRHWYFTGSYWRIFFRGVQGLRVVSREFACANPCKNRFSLALRWQVHL